MMGSKERHFAPLIHVSLEELVAKDHFYRHLERSLDLSFVYEFVKETYAGGGRPSIDPVVFFKLQLVMFFEGIRSERQLMRHAADRLNVRWYSRGHVCLFWVLLRGVFVLALEEWSFLVSIGSASSMVRTPYVSLCC